MSELREREWYAEKMAKEACKRLEGNGIAAEWHPDRFSALESLLKSIPVGSAVGYGGSRTLQEVGILEHLRQGEYQLLDRDKPGISPEERRAFQVRAMTADIFLSSVNGISLSGELVWIDGYGNRVGPILFGPEKIILVAGVNKIVSTREDAVYRAKNIASPINAYRLERRTPCVSTGFCKDCSSGDRICSYTVVMDKNPIPGRVRLLLVGETLGF